MRKIRTALATTEFKLSITVASIISFIYPIWTTENLSNAESFVYSLYGSWLFVIVLLFFSSRSEKKMR